MEPIASERLRIRTATREDVDAIHEIHSAAVRDTVSPWDDEPWPFEQRRGWWEEHQADPTLPVFVAALDGVVIGFSYLSHYRPKSGYRYTREDTVYIDPRYHRRGIGLALLSAAVEAARELGMHTLIASIEASNDASIELHRRLGFGVIGTERETGYKFGRWLDATSMQLMLAPRDA